ncbi:probable LRR receptor-like serine/threonine-protein kinase At1g07560 [Pistacia vera]|uniref:probable LRR receptor-like serine/threonine-protein kinase At1g07560 n=1 Tax=Pistacia vera TaxID=55513 RepID=UPI001262CDD5|nr:probable LRR receptor-like serine/threonine-protein kinase At1g07560 [Pistacia vera]
MFGGQKKLLVLELCMVVIVQVIVTISDSKLAAADNKHSEMKLPSDPSDFISIDCGTSGDYIDNETGLFYESDAKYIDTGEINEVSPNFTAPAYHLQVRLLRSFPQGMRNCYTLKPKQGANHNYLIKAIFVYGNYDGKNQFPSFDVYLGVNKWVTIDFVNDSRSSTVLEIMHVPSVDYIDVCLVKTGYGLPFISVLELRPLDNSIYQIQDGALMTIRRYDVGVISRYTRYPVDVYDRLWTPYNFSDSTVISTQSTIYTQSLDDGYKIPAKVLKTAAKSQNASIPLSLYFDDPLDSSTQCYVYFHFTEIEKLKEGQKRELRIELNGERNLTESISLEYLKQTTTAPNNPPINGSRLHFSIYAAEGSNLSPILNAVEALVLVELPLSPTNLNDVNAIKDIKQIYKVTRNWQGDPCVPSNLSWEGLNCSNDVTPRIISLNLSSSKLTGEIATSLFNLEALTSLDLSYNNLTGPLPEFFAQLLNLKVLNLTGNKLTGSVPDALMEKSNGGTLLMRLEGNPDLRLSVPFHQKKMKFITPVIASAIVVLLILLATIALVLFKRRSRGGMITGYRKQVSLKSKNEAYTYTEIATITKNFATVIGEGGFGKVYLGVLKYNTKVAVKVLSDTSKQGYKEFRAEAELLRSVHNKHLLYLIGYCDEDEHKALIYEFMENGNLKNRLKEQTDADSLSWKVRLNIAIDAAKGLEYLHNVSKPPIVHRDLKTSNILIDEKMRAKLADFGLSRVVTESGPNSTNPAGTFGYIDPTIRLSKTLTRKVDVYSFGIILFELITGKPAVIDMDLGSDAYHILEWVIPEIERGAIQNIIDPRLQGQFNANAVQKMANAACSCARPTVDERPDISDVLAELNKCLAIEMDPGTTCKTTSSNMPEEACSGKSTEITPFNLGRLFEERDEDC